MKLSKNLNKIKIISLAFLAIFSFSFFGDARKASAAECAVQYARWIVPNHPDITNLPSDWFNNETPPDVRIDVLIKNCKDKVAEISIVEDDTLVADDDITEMDDMEILIPTDNYQFFIDLTAGETECENSFGGNNDCEYYIKIDLPGFDNDFSSNTFTNGNLKYECDGTSIVDPYPCDEDWAFGNTLGNSTGNQALKGDCEVVSAEFDPNGTQAHGNNPWYTEGKSPEVVLTIKTKKCEDQRVEVSITEIDTIGDDDIDEMDNKQIVISSKFTDSSGINTMKTRMRAGETECEIIDFTGSVSTIPNCQYYITVNPPGWNNEFNTKGRAGGRLFYNCDGLCNKNWSFSEWTGSITGIILQDTPPTPDLQATGQYDLLAPLPGLKTFNIKEEGSLQKYLGIIFALLIGLAGVLAVIMIVVGGIEYMSTDAISGKEEGKERVTQAIIGLLLALGAWLILNTINPDLLSLRFGLKNAGVTSTSTTSGGGATSSLCSDLPALAAKNNVPYPEKNSPTLTALMSCIEQKVKEKHPDESYTQIFGSRFTYANPSEQGGSQTVCNFTRGDDESANKCIGSCPHAVKSCHYGGKAGSNGAEAVDYGNQNNWKDIIEAAKACGAASARCEGKGYVNCVGGGADHIHIDSSSCDSKDDFFSTS